MTTRRKITKKRFAPVADGLSFSSSSISGLLSDSDEDTTQKQEQDVAGSQNLVLGDKTVDHLGSITQPHDTDNIFISGNPLPSTAVSKLSEQQHKLDEPKDMKNSKINKRNNEVSCERPKELKIDLTMMKMTVSVSPDEDELVVSQRMRSNTSQENGHAGAAKNVLPSSEDSFHIVTDSEEEVAEIQSSNKARTQRTGTEWGLLPAKNGQQPPVNSNDTQKNTSVQLWASSTPLQTMTTTTTTHLPLTSSLISPVTPVMSQSTVKIRRGKRLPVAESENRIVLAKKDLNDAAVVPDIHEEIEEKDNDHSKKHRTSYRKIHTANNHEASDDEEYITIFSTEKHFEVKSGSLENLSGGSSSRIVLAKKDLSDAAVVPDIHEEIEEEDNDHSKRRRTFSRKLYTPKDYEENVPQEGSVIFSAETDGELKCGLSANVHGRSSNRFKITTTNKSRHYPRKSSGVEKNAEVKADDKNNVKSSNNDEIIHLNKRSTRSSQKKRTSDVEHNELPDLRRSIRQRVKPLEYWRGERIKYKIGADRCCEVEGIDPGLPSRQRVHRENPVVHEKKILQFLEDTKEPYSRKLVTVPYGNGKRELECFSTFRSDSDVAKCMQGNYVVYTALKVPGMSAGYVEIGPVCESCAVIDSHLVFCLVVGELTVTIHETVRKVRKGDIFFVPKGVSHLLRNDGEVKSVLLFTKYDD